MGDQLQSMFSAGDSVRDRDGKPAGRIPRKLDLEISVCANPNEITRDWRRFEDSLGLNHACSTWCLAWYKAYQETNKVQPFVITGRTRTGQLQFVLPLELRRIGLLNVLVAPGAGHTTYFAGLYSNQVLQIFRRGEGIDFWEQVLASFDKVDALLIEGFSVEKFGTDHPLALLPQSDAAHGSMRMDISSDWPAQYEEMISSKLKADDRRCVKRLEEFGELKHVVAETPEQRHALLNELLQQKATQFAAMNVVDPFRSNEAAAFYKRLIDIDDTLESSSLYFSALTLDSVPLALNFGLLDDGECHGLITSMTDSDKRRFSPGRLLLGHTNNYLSSIGIRRHDFGMGMLTYKAVWCQRELRRQHVQIGFTGLGRIYLRHKRSIQELKSWLKSHQEVKRFLNGVLNFISRFGK